MLYLVVILFVNAVIIALAVNVVLQSRPNASDAPIVRTVPVPQGLPFDGQTLRLTRFTYEQTSHELLDVILDVENVTAETQTAVVWYILSPPGDPEPWRSAVYSAPEQTLEIAPGTRATVTFAAPVTVPEGEFHLSAWVHGMADGERFHSDGAGVPDTIFVGPAYSFRITEVEQTRSESGGSALSVTFYARNNLPRPIELELSYTLSQPGIERAWENALYTLPFQAARLDPGEEYIVTYRDEVNLPEGTYQLIGWLHESVRGAESVEIARFAYPNAIEIP